MKKFYAALCYVLLGVLLGNLGSVVLDKKPLTMFEMMMVAYIGVIVFRMYNLDGRDK